VWTPLPAPPPSSGFVTTDLGVFDINDRGTIVGAASDPSVNNGTEQGFVLGSSPRSASAVEGTVPEGTNFVELTGGCGSSKTVSRGLSIYGVGLQLNAAALPGRCTLRQMLSLVSLHTP
jgi:hypothetical protein